MRTLTIVFCCIPLFMIGCGSKTSDDVQQAQQEKLLMEGTSQVGMPNIINFRERRILKDVYELRDQDGLVTYTYVHNVVPRVIPGVTSKGGALTFFGETVGYGVPYSAQFSNPQKVGILKKLEQNDTM